jgi:hypothetical protein
MDALLDLAGGKPKKCSTLESPDARVERPPPGQCPVGQPHDDRDLIRRRPRRKRAEEEVQLGREPRRAVPYEYEDRARADMVGGEHDLPAGRIEPEDGVGATCRRRHDCPFGGREAATRPTGDYSEALILSSGVAIPGRYGPVLAKRSVRNTNRRRHGVGSCA